MKTQTDFFVLNSFQLNYLRQLQISSSANAVALAYLVPS